MITYLYPQKIFTSDVEYKFNAHLDLRLFEVPMDHYRTKQWMADAEYTSCQLFYPKAVADIRFPSGLPAGPFCWENAGSVVSYVQH